MANVNRMRSKRRMELTVSGTEKQEDRHVTQQSMPSPAKTTANLLRTALLPIIYTPAQLHETFKSFKPLQYNKRERLTNS